MSAPEADAATRDLVLAWVNRLDGEYLIDPLPAPTREIFEARLAVLRVAFKSSSDTDLLEYVAEMLQLYPYRKHADEKTYVYVLQQYVAAPIWAVAGAVKRVCVGAIPKNEFCPMPSQLRALAWGIAAPFRGEALGIKRVLAARPPRMIEGVERRAEVAARILGELSQRGFALKLEQKRSVMSVSSREGLDQVSSSGALSKSAYKYRSLPDF